MNSSDENLDRARPRRTLGLRPLLFLASAVLVILVTGAAAVVLYVHHYVAAEEAASAVFQAALSQAEAELERRLQPAKQSIRIARDWSVLSQENTGFSLLSPDVFRPLLDPAPMVCGATVYRQGGAFSLRRENNGWSSSIQQAGEQGTQFMVRRWDPQGRPLSGEPQAVPFSSPEAEDWYREALSLCRLRNDLNQTEMPDIYWGAPVSTPDVPVPVMSAAFAVGPGPGETVLKFDLRLDLIADGFVGLYPTPGGYVALFTESGQPLGLTGARYDANRPDAPAAPLTLSPAGQPGLAEALARWNSSKDRESRPFMLRINQNAWWFAIRRVVSRENPPLILAAAAPVDDLLFGVHQARDNLLLVGLWGVVAALALSLVLAAILRRPILGLLEQARRHGASEAAYQPQLKSRVTEMRALLEATQGWLRESVQPLPQHNVVSPDTAPIPDAQLQALFSARKEVRDSRTRLEEVRATLREQEAARILLAKRAHDQREALRSLVRSQECRDGGPRNAAAKFMEAAAASLDTARAGLWTLDSDGVLICMDRYETASQAHASGMLLSRAEYPEWFDAMELDPAVAVADVNEERWSRRLAAALGGAPTATALIACPVRIGANIAAVVIYEHTNGPRIWSVDEENQAITFTQALSQFYARPPAPETSTVLPESPAENAGPWAHAPVALWAVDAVGCITHVSRAAQRIYGYTPEQLVGRSFAFLGGDETGQADLEHLLGCVSENITQVQRITTHRCKDGAMREVRIVAAPMRNPEGVCTGMAGIIEPVDETARLAGLGHMLRFLGARDEFMFLALDPGGRVLWLTVSPELEDRLETDLRDTAGRGLHDLLKTWRAPEQQEVFATVVQVCRPQRSEFAAQFPGGSYEFEATYFPVLEDGEAVCVLLCLRENTLGQDGA